jgi:ATP-dependent Clp protease ATP-binding subunit ClpA
MLLDPLSVKLLEGEFKPGDHIKVTAKGEQLEFKRAG